MSRRAIRRYEQLADGEHSTTENSISSADENETLHSPPVENQPQSLFALLGNDSETASDGEEEDQPNLTDNEKVLPQNVNSEGENPKTDVPNKDDSPFNSSTETDVFKKKKKKKKRKPRKRIEQTDKPVDDPDWIALNEFQAKRESELVSESGSVIPASYFNNDDDVNIRQEAQAIMVAIERIAFPDASQEQISLLSEAVVTCKAMHVEPKLLNADSELKRLFGSRVIDMERRDTESSAAASGRRRDARANPRHALRRRISLVSPRDTWIAHAPGLIMDFDPESTEAADDGVKYFRYAHESSYARIQDEYRASVSTHDPNLLVQLISHHPYHVDTLLQLAELQRQMGELDRAAEQVERSLYILEGAWSVSFKPFDGSCRLNFDVLENRSLYIALFRYSQLLTRRGLHRTALEISKLLLNLDPKNDPMGMLMLADSYALLSGEYKWVQDMRDTYNTIPIQYFPNFAASAAIAMESIRLDNSGPEHRPNSSKGKKGKPETGHKTEEKRNEISEEVVKDMLVDAILTFPMIVKPLLNAISSSSTVWTEFRLFEDGWFGAGYADMRVLTRMARVYAERSKSLWNSNHNTELLINCARAAGRLDESAGMGKDERTGQLTSAFVKDEVEHSRVAHCRALRMEAADWLRSSGLYRNVQIADFADSTTNLPAEILAGDEGTQAVGAPVQREVTLARGALEFFQSLLPWREPQDARDNPEA